MREPKIGQFRIVPSRDTAGRFVVQEYNFHGNSILHWGDATLHEYGHSVSFPDAATAERVILREITHREYIARKKEDLERFIKENPPRIFP